MDYEAIDREMSQWLVVARKNGTRFFLTGDETASDRLCRAQRYPTFQAAETAAVNSNSHAAWEGFARWEPALRASI